MKALIASLLGVLISGTAHAALLLGTVVTQPLVDCLAQPGEVVAVMLSSGPVYTLEGTQSFVVNGDRIMVAPTGIAIADCGGNVPVTVTAHAVQMSPKINFSIVVGPPPRQ